MCLLPSPLCQPDLWARYVPVSCPPCPACCILHSRTCLYPCKSRMDPAAWAVDVHAAGARLGWEILHPHEGFFGEPKCCMGAPVRGAPVLPSPAPSERGKLWLERDEAAAALLPSIMEPAALGQVAGPCHPPVTAMVHVAFAKHCPCQAG